MTPNIYIIHYKLYSESFGYIQNKFSTKLFHFFANSSFASMIFSINALNFAIFGMFLNVFHTFHMTERRRKDVLKDFN